jgi:Uma2 family endonuclease
MGLKMAVAHGKPKHTYEDYAKLPEGERVELVDGEFFVSPSPRTRHQALLGKLYRILAEWTESHLAGTVFPAPTDVVLSKHDVVQPDIFFISKARLSIITELNIQGAPDFIIEILSPGEEKRDMVIKKALYEKYGVKEYWIVDPDAQTISAYDLKSSRFVLRKTFKTKETIASFVLSGFALSLAELFMP